MARSRPTTHLRPTPQNRQQAFGMIATGLSDTSATFTEIHVRALSKCREYLADGKASQLSARAGALFFNAMGVAVAAILRGETQAWEQVRKAFAQMYWALEISQHDWLQQGLGYDVPSSNELPTLQFHGLALAGGAHAEADWVARFLHNHTLAGGIDSGVGDEDYLEFYWRLLVSQVDNKWVQRDRIADGLGWFRSLLETADAPDKFARALVEYCDFRLSRAFQFENPDALRPRKPADPMYVFEAQWIAAFPLELFALREICRRATGRAPLLEGEHPLLQSPLMQVPSMLPLAQDELAGQFEAFGRRTYGAQWKPLLPVALQTED